jgi:hypothetical protein
MFVRVHHLSHFATHKQLQVETINCLPTRSSEENRRASVLHLNSLVLASLIGLEKSDTYIIRVPTFEQRAISKVIGCKWQICLFSINFEEANWQTLNSTAAEAATRK